MLENNCWNNAHSELPTFFKINFEMKNSKTAKIAGQQIYHGNKPPL